MIPAAPEMQLWEVAALGLLALVVTILLTGIILERPQSSMIYFFAFTLCFGGTVAGTMVIGLWSTSGVREAIGISGAIIYAVMIFNTWKMKTRRTVGDGAISNWPSNRKSPYESFGSVSRPWSRLSRSILQTVSTMSIGSSSANSALVSVTWTISPTGCSSSESRCVSIWTG